MADRQLTHDVADELASDPTVDAENIGVTAHERAITLTGYVATNAQKDAAVRAAQRVSGVRAVADEIDVRRKGPHVVDDSTISEAIQRALEADDVPESVQVEVREARVTLRGGVDWQYQRRAAEDAVSEVRGVRGVTNAIVVRPPVRPSDVEQRIEDALLREAKVVARSLRVTTDDGIVTLRGHVRSLHERKAAADAAASAAGVAEVRNRITVRP